MMKSIKMTKRIVQKIKTKIKMEKLEKFGQTGQETTQRLGEHEKKAVLELSLGRELKSFYTIDFLMSFFEELFFDEQEATGKNYWPNGQNQIKFTLH